MNENTSKRYKDCLTAIYDDCQKHGKIQKVIEYGEMYGTNKANLGTILVRLNILKKGEHFSYSWNKNMRKPDHAMIIEVVDALNNYGLKKESTSNKPSLSSTAAAINLDDLLDAFAMLPNKLNREEKKKIAKEMVEWKHSK